MRKYGIPMAVQFVITLVVGLLFFVLPARADGWIPGQAGVTGESVAIQTLQHSSYADGLVRLEFDWRDNTGEVLRFRCINDSDYSLWGGVYVVDPVTYVETEFWTGTCQPHTTVTLPVNRFNLAWNTADEDGDGLPDGGLMMGNYQIRTRWPG